MIKNPNIKNILLIATTSTLSSGATWSLIYLAAELKSHGKNVIVILPSPGDSEAVLKSKGIKYYIIRHYNIDWIESTTQKQKKPFKDLLKRILNIRAQILLNKIIDREHIDLVHINALTDYLGANFKRKKSLKLVWHIREFLEEDLGERFKNKDKSLKLIQDSDAIIAISNEITKKYDRYFNNKINVIYNGVDLDRFYTKHKILDSDNITITIAGRIAPQKGQDQLIKAALRLMEFKNLTINIIGTIQSQEYYQELNNLLANSVHKDKFKFINFTSEIDKYLKQSDIIAVCSKREAFGRVTIEAMASGALVIGANTGASIELIKDRETGLLYEEGNVDSLEEILDFAINNPSNSRQMALKGQDWAIKNFSYQRNAQKILDLYNGL